MATRKLRPGAGLSKDSAVRRFFPNNLTMLIFPVILATLSGITGAASTDAAQAFFQKGKTTMQQENPAPRADSGNLPTLEVPAPARVDTFTFGLG